MLTHAILGMCAGSQKQNKNTIYTNSRSTAPGGPYFNNDDDNDNSDDDDDDDDDDN